MTGARQEAAGAEERDHSSETHSPHDQVGVPVSRPSQAALNEGFES
jgi:hypothetical protein